MEEKKDPWDGDSFIARHKIVLNRLHLKSNPALIFSLSLSFFFSVIAAVPTVIV